MINTRTLIILAVLLIVLGGLSFWQQASHRTRTAQPAAAVVLEGEFAREGLDRLTLGQGPDGVTVDLEKTPAGWVAASAFGTAANPNRIDGLLEATECEQAVIVIAFLQQWLNFSLQSANFFEKTDFFG